MDLEKITMQQVRRVGSYIKEHAFNQGNVEWKELDDPVTSIDSNAERMFKENMSKHLDAGFVGEEFGMEGLEKEVVFYIDPIDGTKSFLKKEFFSSLSVAVEKDNELTLGFVYDFMKDILYVANEKEAYMLFNDKRYDLPLKREKFSKPSINFNVDNVGVSFDEINKRKTIGSVALAMAQLTTSYDALIMQPYKKNGVMDTCDIAAGYFIMKQAGLKITDFNGDEYDYKNPNNGLVATYKEHEGLVKEVLAKLG